MSHAPGRDQELTVTAGGLIMRIGMALTFLGSVLGMIFSDGPLTGMAGLGIFLMLVSWAVIAAAKPRLGPVPSSWEAYERYSNRPTA